MLLGERRVEKSLTDWHVDSEENDKSAMAEHCALRWEREEPRESSVVDQAFIYLTPSSSAGTSVSDVLTHSIPETIALARSFTWSGGIIGACRCCSQRNGRYAALSSVSSERTFGFARRVAALHLEIEQQRRILRSSVSFRLVMFIDRISANFVKSRAAFLLLAPWLRNYTQKNIILYARKTIIYFILFCLSKNFL